MRAHICSVLALSIFVTVPSVADDPVDSPYTEKEYDALDRIEAKVVGRLNTVWDTGKPTQGINRDRKRVHSTTVGVTKP